MAPLVPLIGQRHAEVQAGRGAGAAAARVRVAVSRRRIAEEMNDNQKRLEQPAVEPSAAQRLRYSRLSGKASAVWLVVCFGLTAVLIPMVFRLPRWVNFEIVLALWWSVWLFVLTWLLFTGRLVTDDHQLGKPGRWLRFDFSDLLPSLDLFDILTFGHKLGDEMIGCALGVLLIAIVAVVWILIELAIPVILFLLYFVTRGMLAQVVNDRHHCKGRPGRALSRGFLWATVYTAPLAAAVWYVHYVYRFGHR